MYPERVNLEVIGGTQIVAGLRAALAGEAVVGIVPELAAQPYLEMLRPTEPLEYPDAAVVIATSGTTGNPKGAVLSADAIRFSVEASHAWLGGAGRWVCALPTHHVAGMMTVARGLVGGKGTSFCDPSLRNLPVLGERSYLSLVPAQLHRALKDPKLVEALASYDAILLGGSAIPAGMLEAAAEAGLRVVITYGMSETCGGCVYDRVALPGVGLEIVDGRVALSGEMAFSGYRLNPELTAATLQGKRVMTRDLGTVKEGKLYLGGRQDDVVVSGGENVDLAAAQQIADGVFGIGAGERVVLLDVPDERFGVKIVALSQRPLSLARIAGQLAGRLEKAAVPKEVRTYTGRILLDSGKIDRVGLRRHWQDEAKPDVAPNRFGV
ncbi:MAG: AMP-binding protein [Propionibacteriaceae bacterium]|nr:AMP-binding protein [Propionibacteriaceae bacterium]